jgi:hypothetical protein
MRRSLVALSFVLASACGGSASTSPCAPCTQPSSAPLGFARSAKVEQLAERRVELARKRLAQLRGSFDRGAASLDQLFAALRDVAFAARDSGVRGAPLRAILTEYRDAVVALQGLTRERVAKGAVGEESLSRVEGLVAEAELWLAQTDGL